MRFKADDDPMLDVMGQLDLEEAYRENLSVLIIRRGDTVGNGLRNPTYTMAVTHGTGGGIQTGSSVNRGERFAAMFDGVDMVITGHTHKGAVTKPSKIKVDARNKRVTLVDCPVISCTSWLQYGGYALVGMMTPASNDLQSITLKGSEKKIVTEW